MGFFSSLREHFKGASTPLERKLVLKLDFFILTFCCLGMFMLVNLMWSNCRF